MEKKTFSDLLGESLQMFLLGMDISTQVLNLIICIHPIYRVKSKLTLFYIKSLHLCLHLGWVQWSNYLWISAQINKAKMIANSQCFQSDITRFNVTGRMASSRYKSNVWRNFDKMNEMNSASYVTLNISIIEQLV